MIRTTLCIVVMTLVAAAHVAAQSAIFIVRHAERADAGMAGGSVSEDPELSARGRERARSLAGMLRDAGIRAIYATEWKRTRQTVEPLAAVLGVQLTLIPAAQVTTLVEKVRSSAGDVLIVGHSNTIPKILSALGAAESVEIADDEYDNLFIVIPDEQPRLVRLRYR